MNLYLWVSLMTYSLELLWINLSILNYSQPSKNRQRKLGLLLIHHGYLNLFSCMKLNESDMVSMLDEALRLHCISDCIILSATRMQINFMKNVLKNWTDVIFKAYLGILLRKLLWPFFNVQSFVVLHFYGEYECGLRWWKFL